jgi:hypothetical protein
MNAKSPDSPDRKPVARTAQGFWSFCAQLPVTAIGITVTALR